MEDERYDEMRDANSEIKYCGLYGGTQGGEGYWRTSNCDSFDVDIRIPTALG